MARKRARCSHQHSTSAPTVPPTCSAAPGQRRHCGGTWAAPISVGVQLMRKKYPIRLQANISQVSGVIAAKPVAEQIDRVRARRLLLVLDHETALRAAP